MKLKKLLLSSAVCILILAFLVTQYAFSGITGKVSGFVKDAETGDPLPGVNVMLEGTSMGGATDLDGYFFIINVPPGSYVLKATMMGYKTANANIHVRVDFGTNLPDAFSTIIQEN